jgi:hypothetical protein
MYSTKKSRTLPDLNQGPADLRSAVLTTELCIQFKIFGFFAIFENTVNPRAAERSNETTAATTLMHYMLLLLHIWDRDL